MGDDKLPLTLKSLRREGDQTIVEVGMECYDQQARIIALEKENDALRDRCAALEAAITTTVHARPLEHELEDKLPDCALCQVMDAQGEGRR